MKKWLQEPLFRGSGGGRFVDTSRAGEWASGFAVADSTHGVPRTHDVSLCAVRMSLFLEAAQEGGSVKGFQVWFVSVAELRRAVAPTREGELQRRPCLPQKDPSKQINNKKSSPDGTT